MWFLGRRFTFPGVVVYQIGTLVLLQFKTFGTKKEFPSPAMTTFISVVSESSTQEALRGYPITTAGSTGTKTHFQVGPLSRQDA